MLRAEHEAGRGEVADAQADRLAAAKKVADAVAERDLARQMLKGVQAMLGHAEAARSSAQRALQQAQAEKAASQVCHPKHTSSPPTISLQTCQAYISGSPGALICSALQQAEKASVHVCSHPQHILRAHILTLKACTVQSIRRSNRQMGSALIGTGSQPSNHRAPHTHMYRRCWRSPRPGATGMRRSWRASAPAANRWRLSWRPLRPSWRPRRWPWLRYANRVLCIPASQPQP